MSSQSLSSRIATVSDVSSIFDILKISWLDTYPNKEYNITTEDIKLRFANSTERLKKRENQIRSYDENTCGWIAEIGTEIAGFTHAFKENKKGHLAAIYVLPKFQGKGVGKILMKEVLSFLEGCDTTETEVASYNINAISFYEKYGFEIIPESEGKHQISDEKSIPTIKMLRKKY